MSTKDSSIVSTSSSNSFSSLKILPSNPPGALEDEMEMSTVLVEGEVDASLTAAVDDCTLPAIVACIVTRKI